MGSYVVTAEDLQILRQQADAVLTTAWRADQRNKALKSGKLPVAIYYLVEEYSPEHERVIPNIK